MPEPLWRVTLSHTSDLRSYPMPYSFVDAAEDTVKRAGHAVSDMKDLPAGPLDPAAHCKAMVEAADVYIGIIGMRYGSVVRGCPTISYTELEFNTATDRGLPRLIFLLPSSGPDRVPGRQPAEHTARQQAFRWRLEEEAGVTTAHVATPHELQMAIFHALVALRLTGRRR
jgi:hypothetical protein